jgi:hypothetical protein
LTGTVPLYTMAESFQGGKFFLNLDEKLLPGEYLVSPDRKSKAVLQADGNFVVRASRLAIFVGHCKLS